LKTLETLIYQARLIRLLVVVFDSKYYRFQGFLTIDGIVLGYERQSVRKDQTVTQNNGIYISSAGAKISRSKCFFPDEINTAIAAGQDQ
jgi:hypothetical protein